MNIGGSRQRTWRQRTPTIVSPESHRLQARRSWMVNRLSVLMLVVGGIAAYAMAGSSAAAQIAAVPFSVGDTVTLQYVKDSFPAGDLVECSVAEIRGMWVRCAPGSSFRSDRDERWRSL